MVKSKKITFFLWAIVSVGLFSAKVGETHPLGPSLLKVTEHSPGRVSVEWKTPLQAVPGTRLQPVMPPHCAPQGESKKENKGGAYVQRWKAHCQDSLVGSSFAVRGILESKADVILRVGLADGRTFNTVLTEDRVVFVVPKRESPLDLGRSYLILGFDHILTGLDHLLFILGLVLLISHGRQLLWTVTAFTLGHSLTLSLAALGLVNIPTAPVEALIALSIVALALELTRAKKTPPTFFHRFPWVMALGFGLLHGLGFAGALAEVGLPTGDIPLALFSFNVGIEMGQLLFIAGILMVRALWRLISLPYSTLAYRLIVYGIGSLSAYWFLERIFSVW